MSEEKSALAVITENELMDYVKTFAGTSALTVGETKQFIHVAQAFNLKIIGGSEDYVFKRYSAFYKDGNYDYIVRITSDCPVLQPFLAEQLIREAVDNNLDYAQIQTPNDFPDGFDVEVFKSSLLPRLEQIAKEDSMTREHVTWALKFDTRFDKISKWNLPKDSKYNLPKISIDTVEDLKRIQGLKGDLWWLD